MIIFSSHQCQISVRALKKAALLAVHPQGPLTEITAWTSTFLMARRVDYTARPCNGFILEKILLSRLTNTSWYRLLFSLSLNVLAHARENEFHMSRVNLSSRLSACAKVQKKKKNNVRKIKYGKENAVMCPICELHKWIVCKCDKKNQNPYVAII